MSRAKYRPSELEKLELCSAYRGSAYDTATSAEGTMLHEAMLDWLFNNIEPVLEREHKSLAHWCRERVLELLDRCTAPVATGEQRLDIYTRGPIRMKGNADVLVIDGDHVYVIDYKFGRLPVTPADGNLQGWCYALGAFRTLPGIKKVTIVFLAPHFQDMSEHTFEFHDCGRITTRIAAVVSRCRLDNNPTPHPTACEYCCRKAECPALSKIALEVSAKYTGLSIPAKFLPGPDTTPEQRNVAQHLAKVLADWGKLWKDSNKAAVLEDGVVLPDFDLRSRSGARTVLDVSALACVLESHGISNADLLAVSKVTIGELDNLLAKKEKGEKDPGMKERILDELETSGVIVSNPDSVYLQRKAKASLGKFIETMI